MKRIVFFVNQLCGRGTTDMIYNYAKYNEVLLGNKSIIMTLTTPFHDHKHNQESIKTIQDELEVVYVDGYDKIDTLKYNTDIFYVLKQGYNDEAVMSDVKNLIHSVFPSNDPHGNEYFYISKYCADMFRWDNWIEPIIDIKTLRHEENWRSKFGIKESDIIFGRSGGYKEFDIQFVKDEVVEILKNNKNIHFWFTNTEKFYDHKNIKYFDFLDKRDLISFINSCDCMLHARKDGECFGLSIAEFSMCNKPVITYTKSNHMAHTQYLSTFFGYDTQSELHKILTTFHPDPTKNWNFYNEFSPNNIMQKFNKLL